MANEAKRSGGALSRLVLWLLVVALLAAVWWLASERNARRFFTETRDGQIVVARGRFFPLGSTRIGPEDAQLFRLYQPVPLPAGMKPPADREYEDQAALDRGLFDLLLGAAKAAVQKGDGQGLSQTEALAQRIAQLPGLSPDQIAQVGALRGDLAFTAARGDLAEALKLVRAARAKLEDVRRAGGGHAAEVDPLAGALDGVAAALSDAAEGRLQPRSAPAASPEGPAGGEGPRREAPPQASSPR